MNASFCVIAIDGGAGTGKSTTANLLSQRLNLMHVDTGSHYRTVSKFLLDVKVEPDQVEDWLKLNPLTLDSTIESQKSFLSVNDKKFTHKELRSDLVNGLVSQYAMNACVRKLLFSYQRNQVQLARERAYNGLVMEGRDIGTIILPDADLKVFLHADQGVRESRRAKDGENDQISSRDKVDSQRKIAPLRESRGSLRLDTSVLGVEEVYLVIQGAVRNK